MSEILFEEFADIFSLLKSNYTEINNLYNSFTLIAEESLETLVSEDDLTFTAQILDASQIAVENENYQILTQGQPSLNQNADKDKKELLTLVFEKDSENLRVSIQELSELSMNLDKVKEVIEPAYIIAMNDTEKV